MTRAEQLADYVVRAGYDDMNDQIRWELKIRILDSLGCALGAMRGEPIRLIRDHLRDFGKGGHDHGGVGGDHGEPAHVANRHRRQVHP